MNKEKLKTPVYQRIAADIASKIVEGHYNVGDKIYARSTLATLYKVSSETARRAINILVDMQVCESRHGSGVTIKSKEKAIEFIKAFENIKTTNQLKREIIDVVNEYEDNSKKLKNLVIDLVDKTNRFKSVNPFVPYDIELDENVIHLNKSLSEVRFWNNTFATIVGIRRKDQLIMSPGPNHILKVGDIIYFVGNETSREAVRSFLYER